VGIYADPTRVHAVGHSGPYFSVPSAHLSEPSVQRTPVIFQAGTSPRGRIFAAKNAEVVFVAGFTPQTLRKNIEAIKSLARDFGRGPESIKFIASAVVVTDATDAAAEAKLRDYQRYYSVEGTLTHFSAITGIDWSSYDLDAPLSYIETESNRSILAGLTKDAPSGESWTLRKILAPADGISYGNSIVGSGATVASRLEAIADEAGVDGFNLSAANPHVSYGDLAQYVVPLLRRRGRIRDKVPGRSLRASIFEGEGEGPRVAEDHPASRYRNAFAHHGSSAPTLLG
jgi:long-chain alkane monooxygenase